MSLDEFHDFLEADNDEHFHAITEQFVSALLYCCGVGRTLNAHRVLVAATERRPPPRQAWPPRCSGGTGEQVITLTVC